MVVEMGMEKARRGPGGNRRGAGMDPTMMEVA
jgi:hypothetical protein